MLCPPVQFFDPTGAERADDTPYGTDRRVIRIHAPKRFDGSILAFHSGLLGAAMKRREAIVLAGSAAAAWPRAAFADAPSSVGLLSSTDPISDKSPRGAALIRGLAQHGYTPGRNLAFERRGADGHLDRMPRLAAELAAARVDVIMASGYPAALAAKERTTVPTVVVFAGDPVGTGLVESLARPTGNITGISDVSAELTPKRIELLRQIAPGLRRLAILYNASDLGMTLRYRASDSVAKVMGLTVMQLGVREPDDFGNAFTAMDADRPDAILMVSDSLTMLNRKRVFDYAAANRLPAMYEIDVFAHDGGLMSYGPDFDETFGRVAALIDRILKGAKPTDLPFEQPTLFKLAINLKTARALGIEVPPALLIFADEVIE
jgi:putative ABC transport system substrate-binding protein